MRLSVSYFWLLSGLRLSWRLFHQQDRIRTGTFAVFVGSAYETLVPYVDAVGFPSGFTSSGASGSPLYGGAIQVSEDQVRHVYLLRASRRPLQAACIVIDMRSFRRSLAR